MKFFLVKVDLIPEYSTRHAWVDETCGQFHPLLTSFLPSPVPPLGLVSDYERAQRTVLEIYEGMNEMPTLADSAIKVGFHVWGYFFDEVHLMRLLNTTRADTDKRGRVGNEMDCSSRIFELADFKSHMEQHHEHTTLFLKRRWRDNIIAEVLDRLGEKHNFFTDNEQQHVKSTLHRILKRFDTMLSTQMRTLVEKSLEEWNTFMRSFMPNPMISLPSPLLIVYLVPAGDQVLVEPDPEELIETIM